MTAKTAEGAGHMTLFFFPAVGAPRAASRRRSLGPPPGRRLSAALLSACRTARPISADLQPARRAARGIA
jgi:hypothetical protein